MSLHQKRSCYFAKEESQDATWMHRLDRVFKTTKSQFFPSTYVFHYQNICYIYVLIFKEELMIPSKWRRRPRQHEWERVWRFLLHFFTWKQNKSPKGDTGQGPNQLKTMIPPGSIQRYAPAKTIYIICTKQQVSRIIPKKFAFWLWLINQEQLSNSTIAHITHFKFRAKFRWKSADTATYRTKFINWTQVWVIWQRWFWWRQKLV